MNDKEIGEIRRHLRRDRSNITAIYGCYVNDNKEVISEFRQSTGIMPENESDKYFALLRHLDATVMELGAKITSASLSMAFCR